MGSFYNLGFSLASNWSFFFQFQLPESSRSDFGEKLVSSLLTLPAKIV